MSKKIFLVVENKGYFQKVPTCYFASDNQETAESCKKDLEMLARLKEDIDENNAQDDRYREAQTMLIKKWCLSEEYVMDRFTWRDTSFDIEVVPFLHTAQ